MEWLMIVVVMGKRLEQQNTIIIIIIIIIIIAEIYRPCADSMGLSSFTSIHSELQKSYVV